MRLRPCPKIGTAYPSLISGLFIRAIYDNGLESGVSGEVPQLSPDPESTSLETPFCWRYRKRWRVLRTRRWHERHHRGRLAADAHLNNPARHYSPLRRRTVRVDVIHNEVWITRNPGSSSGVSKQLTHDGKAKIQAELSSAGDRIAYYEQCPESEHCRPTVVILDLEGNRLQTFQPRTSAFGSDETCGSILRISWVRDDSTIGVRMPCYSFRKLVHRI